MQRLFNTQTQNNSSLKDEIKLKMHKGLNNDDPSVMYINTLPSKDQAVMAFQSQAWAGGHNTNTNAI